MVAANLAIYQVTPGRGADFQALAGDYGQYLDGFGVRTSFRQALHSEQPGSVAMVNMAPDSASLAAALDKMLADTENNPMLPDLTSANPSATLLRRSLLDSVDPQQEMPEPPNILQSAIYSTTAANTGVAVAAAKAGIELHRGFGAVATAWTIVSGPASGSILYGLGVESMTALQKLIATVQAHDGPRPLLDAARAGAITLVSRQTSVLFET